MRLLSVGGGRRYHFEVVGLGRVMRRDTAAVSGRASTCLAFDFGLGEWVGDATIEYSSLYEQYFFP